MCSTALKNRNFLEGDYMAIKSIFKISLMAILIITILNCTYADTGPYVGENQAKTIAQSYLTSHNLPYKVTTTTQMYKLDNYKKPRHIRWVSSSQLDNKSDTFEGVPLGDYVGSGTLVAWKVNIANSDDKEIGNIWINVDGNGDIIKIDLPNNKQNTKIQSNTNSNQTNTTNQTFPESNSPSDPLGSDAGIIFGIIILIIVLGAGYFMYTKL